MTVTVDATYQNGTFKAAEPVSLPEGAKVRLVITTVAGQAKQDNQDWSDESNERRIDLIDKDIEGSITIEERAELADGKAVAYRDRVAPFPIEAARRLHPRAPRPETPAGRQPT